VQLGLEYDPHPPFQAGSPKTASPEEVERARQRMQASIERRHAASRIASARLAEHIAENEDQNDRNK